MIRFLATIASAIVVALILTTILVGALGDKPAPAKTETLNCVRVKEVPPAGTINYLCEVRK